MVVVHWKYLVFLLFAIFLFGCEYESDPEIIEPDHKPVKPPFHGGNSITSDHNVIELDVDDVEALLPDIRVPTNRDNKKPIVDIVNNDALPEIDIDDIQNIIPDVKVPVHEKPKKDEKKDVTSPKIVRSNIKDGAKDVGRASLTRITFSEPIAKGTLVLRTEGGRVVETDIQYGDKIVNIERLGEDSIMKPLTTYIIEGSVSDAAGNKTKINITFTTADVEAIKAF